MEAVSEIAGRGVGALFSPPRSPFLLTIFNPGYESLRSQAIFSCGNSVSPCMSSVAYITFLNL